MCALNIWNLILRINVKGNTGMTMMNCAIVSSRQICFAYHL